MDTFSIVIAVLATAVSCFTDRMSDLRLHQSEIDTTLYAKHAVEGTNSPSLSATHSPSLLEHRPAVTANSARAAIISAGNKLSCSPPGSTRYPTHAGQDFTPLIATSIPLATNYQVVVDEWRSRMGLKALANDARLVSNAVNTVISSNGQMVHKLSPGSYGQVLAPGNADDFEKVFVGGWLCEIPTLPGLQGVCSTQSDGWAYNGQTGHAEMLTSDDFSKIGCAWFADIWCCDLA